MSNLIIKNKIDKHYDLISSRYKLSAIEQKLVLSIISMIRPDDTDFMNYQIPVTQFDFITDNKNHQRLRKHCKDLMSKPLEIFVNDEDWIIFNWFSHIRLKNGMIECSIAKELKPYLLQLKSHFKTYDLKYVLNMESSYSIRIYELLKKSEKLGYLIISLENLQDLLQVPTSMNRYDNFKRKVIQVAAKEIARDSDIYFDIEEIKAGRKVVSLKFLIYKNFQNKEDDKDFYKWVNLMRETYINQELIYYKKYDANVRINTKGNLYLDNGESITPEKAKEFWKWAYHNQDKLITPQLKF